MEARNYLGIYISKSTATVVCLGLQGRDRNVLGCFRVSVEQQQDQNLQALAALIAQRCTERELKFTEVVVALDCAMFTQHNVHSDFTDPKQIAATVRFDTEEALATDITDTAIAFKILSTNTTGSDLTVFTAQRKLLSDLLGVLQTGNIDPITMEPDVNCLARFISHNITVPDGSNPLFCVLSDSRGYFITSAEPQNKPMMRTFLLDPAQNRIDLLETQVPVTAALVGTGEPINRLVVFDSTSSVDYQQLGKKLGIETTSLDLAGFVAAEPQTLSGCADTVGFAIAYGAALAHLEKTQTINFRNDFSPYQGKKIRLQKTLKFLSVAVSILVVAAGLYFQMQLLQRNKYRSQLRKKLEKQYSAVMFGKKPPAKTSPVKKLASELRRIESVKKGLLSITGEEAVSAKLTLVLEAFNKCAKQTDLNIDSISITTRVITIVGDTSSRKNTLKLFETIRKNKLQILQQRLDAKAGRDNFHITLKPQG